MKLYALRVTFYAKELYVDHEAYKWNKFILYIM